MEKKEIVMIILISVIVLVLASLTIPVFLKMPQAGSGKNPAQPQDAKQPQKPQQTSGHQESILLKTVISFVNIGLIIPLFVIYTGIYYRIRSSFTLGLMAVIFALGMYAVMSNPLLMSIPGVRPGDIGVFQIIPDICAMVALFILIRISLE